VPRDWSLLKNACIGSGAYRSSFSMGTMVLFWGVKQLRSEVNHPSRSGVKVKNEWNGISTPPICLYGMDGENFTFYTC
jgi:hypothetical protein